MKTRRRNGFYRWVSGGIQLQPGKRLNYIYMTPTEIRSLISINIKISLYKYFIKEKVDQPTLGIDEI